MDLPSETSTPRVTTRRDFLKLSAQTLGLIGLGGIAPNLRASRATAAGATNILVLIHLAGGNDGLNTVVPLRDERYLRLRPNLAIPPRHTLGLNENYGLHPVCAGLHDLYLEKRLAILPHVSAASLSHFGATDAWNGRLHPAKSLETGWLGRILDHNGRGEKSAPAAIHFSAQPPACLRGAKPHRICGLDTPSAGGSPANEDHAGKFPPSRFGRNLQKIAALIRNGTPTRIYHLTLSGFDTHSHQAAAHASLLRILSEGIAAFERSLRRCGESERVLTVAYSEFGRTLRENERLGTDHAATGPVFLCGNYSELHLPNLLQLDAQAAPAHANSEINCRDVLATLARDWLGCQVFPPLV